MGMSFSKNKHHMNISRVATCSNNLCFQAPLHHSNSVGSHTRLTIDYMKSWELMLDSNDSHLAVFKEMTFLVTQA